MPAEAVRTEVASAANAWSGGPGPNVLFVGAEPFSHPELPVLVAAAVAAGYERIGLRTDAGALSMPGNAEGVLSAGVLHLQLVLTGGDGASHDSNTGRPGLFDSARHGVAQYKRAAMEAGLAVAITGYVSVCAHTMPGLPGIVATLAGLGAVAVELAVTPRGAGEAGLLAWLGSAVDTGMVNGVWVSVSGLAPDTVVGSPLHAVAPSRVRGASA